jgi:hypothetical protein
MPMIFRLLDEAEQVNNPKLRSACLDWWDSLLEARIGAATQLLDRFQAGDEIVD